MAVTGRSIEMIAFSIFSYIENIFYILLNILPMQIRAIFYRVLFKKYGYSNYIDHNTYFRYIWKIELGSNITINRGSQLFGSMHSKVSDIIICDDVAIGPNVKLYSASHDYTSKLLADISSQIIINRDCWIGANAIILPGVTLGEGVVVGAGAVVTKSIPEFAVVVGNPARIIKYRKI